jgi:hypothetical protein
MTKRKSTQNLFNYSEPWVKSSPKLPDCTYTLSALVIRKVHTINKEKRLRFPLVYRGLVSVVNRDDEFRAKWQFPMIWVGFWDTITTGSDGSESVRMLKHIDSEKAKQIESLRNDELKIAVAIEIGVLQLYGVQLVAENKNDGYIKTNPAKNDK